MSYLINRTSHLINRTSYLINQMSVLLNRTSYLLNQMSFLLNRTSYLLNQMSFLLNRTSYLINQMSFLLNRTSFLINLTSYLIFLFFYCSTVFICKYTYVPNGTSYLGAVQSITFLTMTDYKRSSKSSRQRLNSANITHTNF